MCNSSYPNFLQPVSTTGFFFGGGGEGGGEGSILFGLDLFFENVFNIPVGEHCHSFI